MFFVGQQVVCIDANNWPVFTDYDPALPVEGEVYEVLAIIREAEWDEDGLVLVEIWNPKPDFSGERVVFRASRFRPVRTTSIEVFRAMLEPVPARKVKEAVDA